MTIQPQKAQYPYDNTTAKRTIQVWQYNCKKYNTRMTIQLQKQYNTSMQKYNIHIQQYQKAKSTIRRMTIQLQKVQYTYDNTTAKSTIPV